ncbi:MAG: M3 family metallopeptidase [Leptospiraceae bacterium]|nr:M3 family metallopeptidase [Leptospiraceae bacterium]MCB1199044.1 M3 family metallopeptidase [Leptospiraceae bacterium]
MESLSSELQSNALLNQFELPDFSSILPEHVVPAVEHTLAKAEQILTNIESENNITWETTVIALREISRSVEKVWGCVNHLLGVKNSPELRKAHEEMQPKVVEFFIRMGQSRKLFEIWEKLEKNTAEVNTSARKRIIQSSLRDARLSGVALEGKQKERFNEIQRDLAALSTRFSNNVLDSTKEFQLEIFEPQDIQGMPESWLQLAAQKAIEKGFKDATPEKGPWVVTLDFPVYFPFLQHCRNRSLREKVYKASNLKASGEDFSAAWNNWEIIKQILNLRQEEATLLGFENFAEVSLASKMAPSPGHIQSMIHELAEVARPAAKAEVETLQEFANQNGLADKLQLWDVSFYAERQRESLFDYTDEQLRPYFPIDKVLSGLFKLAHRLFNVSISASNQEVKVWHSDVRFYDVFNSENKKIASFFLDPYSRSGEKRGGAWMDVCRQREKLPEGKVQLPVAYLVCNGTPALKDRPSLMTFSEVETLFHEFGHGLQHMLTQVDEYEASGIANVEWDAVELPSQFMENWVLERDVMDEISGHFETGETLPDSYFKKIIAARNYMSGSMMLRQLYFSILDLELHLNKNAGERVRDIQKAIAKDFTVIPPLANDAFLCSFSHIFAGGYAAGYYSYKWAEVLSADAFAAFEEAGLSNEAAIKELGQRYRDTVLSQGGARHPLEIYREFRGRDATTEALLRHHGLLKKAA